MPPLSPACSVGAEHLSSPRTTIQIISNLFLSGKFKPVKRLGGSPANKYSLSHQEPPSLCKLNFKFLPTLAPVSLTLVGCESAGTFRFHPQRVSLVLCGSHLQQWCLSPAGACDLGSTCKFLLLQPGCCQLLRGEQKSSRTYRSLLNPQAMERHP